MTTLVVGASGATGRKLVEQLLHAGSQVKVIVRSPEKLPPAWHTNEHLTIIPGSVLDISEATMAEYLQDCDAVASSLGHNLTLKGIYAPPRKLVRDAVRLLCKAIQRNAPEKPVKLVLMNTAGNRNPDLQEPLSFSEKAVLALLRLLLPPHPDNEQAAEHLRTEIGQHNPMVEWAVVRPDSLTNEAEVTAYQAHPSPTRSALFDPGKTSRINVAHFMSSLIADPQLWAQWKGQMPVIYNQSTAK